MVDFGTLFFNFKFMEVIERAFSEFLFASDAPREVLGVPGLGLSQVSKPTRHTILFLTTLLSRPKYPTRVEAKSPE